MGYTPAFDTIYTGTLYGKWPTAAVWASLIPLIDSKGEINLSPEAISGMTGWPLELLVKGLAALEEPDPRSRSKAEDGRRLVRLDPDRDWGWRVVNHGIYREKARLMAKSQREVESGSNKERMGDRRSPPETAGDRQPPPGTASDPLSNSDTNTGKKARTKRASRVPADFLPDLDYARSQLPDIDAEREAQRFRDWEFKTPRSDWAAVWRNWIEHCRDSGKYARRKGGGGSNGLPILNA